MSADPIKIANRAVRDGHLSQEQLDACLAERRSLRRQGLETPLRELLLERGLIGVDKWESLALDVLEKQGTRIDSDPAAPQPSADASASPAPADPALEKPLSPPAVRATATGDAHDLPASSSSDRGPEVLGNYRIRSELGRGAMGVVYEAEHVELGRRVALKVLPETQALRGVARERFLREARATASLQHPGIVPIFEIGEDRGVHHFAMELIEGSSLRQLLEGGGRPPPEEVARLGRDVAEALHHAHERGVIHRDVKPDNVLLRPDGAVVVTDFGLARQAGDRTLTISGAIVGTPLYMSPEQARGEPTDRRSDVYALGVTLYELLAGVAPFEDAPDSHRLLLRVAEDDVPPLRGVAAHVPAGLAGVVEVATAKEPDRRYASAGAMAADLGRFLRGEPILARPPTRLQRLTWRVRRRPLPWVLGLAGLLVLVAGALALRAFGAHSRADGLFAAAERALLDGKAEAARRNLDLALEHDAEHVEALLARGGLRRDAGDLPGALLDFRAAEAAAPDDPRPLVERGVTLFDQDRAPEAVPVLRRGLAPERRVLATRAAAYGRAVLLMGQVELAKGNLPVAQGFLEEAVRMDPDRALPRTLLARTLLQRGNARAAAEAASEALRRDAEDLEALELRGRAHRRLGRHDRALEDLDAARERPGARLERGLVLFEALDVGGTERRAFDLETVRADLEAVTADTSVDTDARSVAHVVLGWLSLVAERPRRSPALRQLDQAVELHPDSAFARCARAQLLLDWGRPEDAQADLEHALELPGGAYAARVGLARIAQAKGDTERARELLDAAISAAPKRPSAYAYRYRLRHALGDAGASEDRQRATAPAPAAEGPVVLTAGTDLLHVTEQATEQGRRAFLESVKRPEHGLPRAEAWLRRARAIDSGNPAAASLWASSLTLLARGPESLAAYGQAQAVDPGIVDYQLGMGAVQRDLLGEPAKAARILRKALQDERADAGLRARLRFELAKTLAEGGKQEAALEVLGPHAEDARHCVAALRLRLLRELGRPVSDEQIDLASRLFYEGERDPNRSVLFTAAAIHARARRQRAVTARFLTRAIEADPQNALAWRTRARVRFQGSPEQFPQGIADEFVAAELNPSATAAMMEIEARLSRFRQVMPLIAERADEILQRSPELPAAAWIKGYLAFTDGRYPDADRWFAEALRLSQGRSYLSQIFLSATALRSGNPKLARERLEAAETIQANNPQSLVMRACLHAQAGETDQAVGCLEALADRGLLFEQQLGRWPELSHLMDDPRVRALLDRAN